MLVISGCSGNSMPFKRKYNPKDDVIKFYNFEWFTEVKTILEKFNKDFGEDTYEVRKWKASRGVYVFTIEGKNNSSLLWDIAGHKLDFLEITCFSKDNGEHCYLEMGEYIFKDKGEETFADLKEKLSELYTKDETHENMFVDKNDNYIMLKNNYSVCYGCMDGDLIFLEQLDDVDETNNNIKNNTNGL